MTDDVMITSWHITLKQSLKPIFQKVTTIICRQHFVLGFWTANGCVLLLLLAHAAISTHPSTILRLWVLQDHDQEQAHCIVGSGKLTSLSVFSTLPYMDNHCNMIDGNSDLTRRASIDRSRAVMRYHAIKWYRIILINGVITAVSGTYYYEKAFALKEVIDSQNINRLF